MRNDLESLERQQHASDWLALEYKFRREKNPSYSLRSFAKRLEIPVGRLTEILSRKRNLTERLAEKISDRLEYGPKIRSNFLKLVKPKKINMQSKHAPDLMIEDSSRYEELNADAFNLISDWYHFAILELTEVIDFKSDIAWIAQRLNIQQEFVEDAVKRLFDFGLLAKRENGDWHQTEAILATPSGIPSTAIRNHHRQVLSKANEAILNFPVAERDFSSTTMAVASEQIEDVQTLIKEFRRSLAKKLSESPEKDRVYCLSIQFFPFDHKEESP